MLSIQQCRTIDPALEGLSDEEIAEIRDALYAVGKLALEQINKTTVSKNPAGVMPSSGNSSTIKI